MKLDSEGNTIGEAVTETKAIKDDQDNIIEYEVITTTTTTEITKSPYPAVLRMAMTSSM